MSAPTDPTLTTLCTEALKKAGHNSPTSAQITHAGDYYMEEIKADICLLSRKLKSLEITAAIPIPAGKRRFDRPTDFGMDLTLTLLDGTQTGTAQSGSTSSITLAATATSAERDVLGRDILITSGTGVNGFSHATAYNTSTKAATVYPNFTTAPSSDSGYLIVDRNYPIEIGPAFRGDLNSTPYNVQRPSMAYPIGDESNGDFFFDSIPDKAYGLRMRYFVDLQTLDLASTRMTTLYRKWRTFWIQGVMAKELQMRDDERAALEMRKYEQGLSALIGREAPGLDLSTLQVTVSD